MDNISLATLRLGKDSVQDIKNINEKVPGVVENSIHISVTCTQVPSEFDMGTIAFLWLGSDNSKGIPTEWKQGFKAVGTVAGINRGDKYNDTSTIDLEICYIFCEAINRLDILRKAPVAYYWCSAMPIIGLDDHSNQTVRMIVTDIDRSDVKAFFHVLNAVRPEFQNDIVHVYPDFEEYFNYVVPDPNIVSVSENEVSVQTAEEIRIEQSRKPTGINVLLYGVPGSGKSWTIEHEYCKADSYVERLVFHPDYTYSDFVGQILPDVDDEGLVTYKFTPGPFTTILRDAYRNPTQEYILIIEEINRGNAPAIFGEVFQLLDRTIEPKRDHEVVYPAGTSEYGITNRYMATVIYGDGGHKVRIPSNLSVIGTMNTSDQNVFTLDTAFQRRWNMRLIENTFENVRASLADAVILDTDVTWKTFCTTINKIVVGNKAKMASAEDKRLGVYFVHENDLEYDERANSPDNNLRSEYNALLRAERDGNLTPDQKNRLHDIREALKRIRKFPEKVIKYLWDDAFKFNPQDLFDTTRFDNLEDIIRYFVFSYGRNRFDIFKQTVRDTFFPS